MAREIKKTVTPQNAYKWPAEMKRRATSRPLKQKAGAFTLGEIQRNFTAGGRSESGGTGAWRPRTAWSGDDGHRLLMLNPGAGLYGSLRAMLTAKGAAVTAAGPHSRIHHYGSEGLPGGVIKPKRAKALTIPLMRSMRGTSARTVSGLFIIRSKAGNPNVIGILAKREGDEIVPHFLLVKAVRIPKRPYMMLPRPRKVNLQKRVGNYIQRGKWAP